MPELHTLGDVDAAGTPGTAALYIASLANELAQIAGRHGFESLEYILKMARLEADQIAKDSGSMDLP